MSCDFNDIIVHIINTLHKFSRKLKQNTNLVHPLVPMPLSPDSDLTIDDLNAKIALSNKQFDQK